MKTEKTSKKSARIEALSEQQISLEPLEYYPPDEGAGTEATQLVKFRVRKYLRGELVYMRGSEPTLTVRAKAMDAGREEYYGHVTELSLANTCLQPYVQQKDGWLPLFVGAQVKIKAKRSGSALLKAVNMGW